jgi:O-6-methylguanine DNA methyltransferase
MINTQIRVALLGYGKECSKKNEQIASVIGRMAGKQGFTLVAGNVTSTFGFAFEASRAYKTANICVIEKHKKHPQNHNATEIYHVKDTYTKHAQIAQMADAAILIGGGPGSQMLLNHFIQQKKSVICIQGSGGLADDPKLSEKVLRANTATAAFKTLFDIKKTIYFSSPIGHMELQYNHLALCSLRFIDYPVKEDHRAKTDPFIKQLKTYLKGKPTEFTGRIHLTGTEFQKSVWQAIMDIPWGKTMEFGELAGFLNKENADGAIGNAALQNPIQIIIPSHRLLTKDGRFNHFPRGSALKMRLLDLEKQQTELSIF